MINTEKVRDDDFNKANYLIQREWPKFVNSIPGYLETVAWLTVDLVLSNNACPPSPYELAIVCKRMTRFYPDDHAKIAAKLCLWPAQVTDYLLLINGPMEIANYVRDEVVSFTLAIEVLKEHGAKALAVIEQSLERARGAGKKLTSRFCTGQGSEESGHQSRPGDEASNRRDQAGPGF